MYLFPTLVDWLGRVWILTFYNKCWVDVTPYFANVILTFDVTKIYMGRISHAKFNFPEKNLKKNVLWRQEIGKLLLFKRASLKSNDYYWPEPEHISGSLWFWFYPYWPGKYPYGPLMGRILKFFWSLREGPERYDNKMVKFPGGFLIGAPSCS